MMKPSFAPLAVDAIEFLTEETGVDYVGCDFTDPRWFCVTQRRDDGTIMGVIACEFKEWFEAHFNAAVSDPSFIRAKLLQTVFSTLFSQAVRVTAHIVPGNDRAEKNARQMGFVYEGYKRLAIEGKRDALLFGMLRHECRFLERRKPLSTKRRIIVPDFTGASHGLVS